MHFIRYSRVFCNCELTESDIFGRFTRTALVLDAASSTFKSQV